MLAAIIVKAFVSIIGASVGVISLFTVLNLKHERYCDKAYRGELDTEKCLKYALHQVG